MHPSQHSTVTNASGKTADMIKKRNMDHLDYDENLYDFMRSLLPIQLKTEIEVSPATINLYQTIDKYLLNEIGLERNSILQVYDNDSVGQRELIYTLILSSSLPKEWNEAQLNQNELSAIIIDIQGSFSARKFQSKIKQYYQQHKLSENIPLLEGQEFVTQEQMTDDEQNFVKQTMQNLYVFKCMDAQEMNMTVRSLPAFMKRHKNIGLVVLDGLHYVDHIENAYEKKGNIGQTVKQKQSFQQMAEMTDIPTGDDFMSTGFESLNTSTVSSSNARKSFLLQKQGRKGHQRHDVKTFERQMADRGLQMLLDLQKTYQFAIVKCQARPQMKKAAEIQEQIMEKGIAPNQLPQALPQDADQAPGLIAPTFQGQIITDDEFLRERIKQLEQGDVLLLRGDRPSSLKPKSTDNSLNECLNKQHLSILIIPQKIQGSLTNYLKRYAAIYLLYKSHPTGLVANDSQVKSFFI